MNRLLAFVLAIVFANSAIAGQTTIPNYDTARRAYFWDQLYVFGGVTIYCSPVFPAEEVMAGGGGRVSLHGEAINIEHAYPAHWMADANGCLNRNECEVEAFNFAEADLHNLWPAVSRINSSRGELPLGVIPGEDQRRFEGLCFD